MMCEDMRKDADGSFVECYNRASWLIFTKSGKMNLWTVRVCSVCFSLIPDELIWKKMRLR